jgi:hypothetical protein
MSVSFIKAKLAWVRNPGVPPGQPAPGSYTCPCGTVTGGQPFGGPAWECVGCGRRYDGRGWLVSSRPAGTRATCSDCLLGASWITDETHPAGGFWRGDRDVEPCPYGGSDFHDFR